MEQGPGESPPSTSLPSPSTLLKSKTNDSPHIMDIDTFKQHFLSTDPQMRKVAHSQLATIPHYDKLRFLWAAFKAANNEEGRSRALSQVCEIVESNWNGIFCQDDIVQLDAFCHEVLKEVQCEQNAVIRETLSYLVALIANNRLVDGVQNWAELISYMKDSPKSTSDHHTIISLAIVMQLPGVFGDRAHIYDAFFLSCFTRDSKPIRRTMIKAFIGAHAATSGTVSGQAQLKEHLVQLAKMIEVNYLIDKEADDSAINELAHLLISLSLECKNMNTMLMSLQVLNEIPKALDNSCLSPFKNLIETALASSHPSACSIALTAYASIISEGANHRSPLRDVFPTIIAMLLSGAEVEEERQMEEESGEEFTALHCIHKMSVQPSPLLQSHLHDIVPLCRELALSRAESTSIEQAMSIDILIRILIWDSYWDDVAALFGAEYLPEFCRAIIKFAIDEPICDKMIRLLTVFATHRTIAQVLQFLMMTADSNSKLKLIGMKILQGIRIYRRALDPIMKALLVKSLSHADRVVRTCAVQTFEHILELMKHEGSRVEETLGTAVVCLLQMAERGDVSEKRDCLHSLNKLATSYPALLKSSLSLCITLYCKMIDDHVFQETAMYLLKMMCKDYAAIITTTNAAEQIPKIIESTLQLAMEADFRDNDIEEDWLAEEHPNFECESSDVINGVVSALGAACTVPNLVTIADKWANDGDWRNRYKSILAYGAVHKGCKEVQEKPIAALILALNDAQPQVRNIACSTLYIVSHCDAVPRLMYRLTEAMLPRLLDMLNDTTIPRLAAIAVETIASSIFLCRNSNAVDFSSTLDAIVEFINTNYLTLLTENHIHLLSGALAPIIALSRWNKYIIAAKYTEVMWPLKCMLRERPRDEVLIAIIEVVALVGKAVGKSKFLADGIEVLGTITMAIESLLSVDGLYDHSTGHGFYHDFEDIITVLGADSHRFLPEFVAPVLDAYKKYGSKKDQIVGRIRSTRILQLLASTMGADFSPFAKEVSVLAIADIRADDYWGTEIFPHLFTSLKMNKEVMRGVWEEYYAAVKEKMKKTDRKYTMASLREAINDSIEQFGVENLTDDEKEEIGALMRP